jgi:predicted Zn-ribbon and HTH transcriptional regulator
MSTNPIEARVQSILRAKTISLLEEAKKQVAAGLFEETDILQEQIDAAMLMEWPKSKDADHALAHELASWTVHQHSKDEAQAKKEGRKFEGGLHPWAKNYSKKKKKGTYDEDLAVKGLTHAIKHHEDGYFGVRRGYDGKKTGNKPTIGAATRTAAAKHLLPHVHALMAGKGVHDIDEAVKMTRQQITQGHIAEGFKFALDLTEMKFEGGFEKGRKYKKFVKYTHPSGHTLHLKDPKDTWHGQQEWIHTTPKGKKTDGVGGANLKKHLDSISEATVTLAHLLGEDWTKENVKCKDCGKDTPALEVFPGSRCLSCHAKKVDGKPLEKPNFAKTINKKVVNSLVKSAVQKKKMSEAREPKKNTGMHSKIMDHGFKYTGTKNGFREYEKDDHKLRHKFPTENGNHSFQHVDKPTGQTLKKGSNVGDTDIHDYLKKNFGTMSEAVKKTQAKPKNVFDHHQLKIARQTLKYSDAGARIMGGMTKDEARAHIHRITGKKPKE